MHFVLVAILSYFDSLWPPFENDSTYLFFYAGSLIMVLSLRTLVLLF
jgi:hypothetical protein